MTTYKTGDIVEVVNCKKYPRLNGMIFRVLYTVHGSPALDVTALHRSGFMPNDTAYLPFCRFRPDAFGWFVKSEYLKLLVTNGTKVEAINNTKAVAPPSNQRIIEAADPIAPKKVAPSGYLCPQAVEVLKVLKEKGSITALEAGGVLRARSLSRRITDLKQAGYKITRVLSKDHTGQRYARYYLKTSDTKAAA